MGCWEGTLWWIFIGHSVIFVLLDEAKPVQIKQPSSNTYLLNFYNAMRGRTFHNIKRMVTKEATCIDKSLINLNRQNCLCFSSLLLFKVTPSGRCRSFMVYRQMHTHQGFIYVVNDLDNLKQVPRIGL